MISPWVFVSKYLRGSFCIFENISSLMLLRTPCEIPTIIRLYKSDDMIPTAYMHPILITAFNRFEKSLLPLESIGVI